MSDPTGTPPSIPKWCYRPAMVSIVVIALLTALLVYCQGQPGLPKILASLLTVLLGLFGAIVLAKMVCGPIDLTLLISEDNGSASMSRLQFLIFTFVIAASYLLLASTANTTILVDVPPGVLGLLGISGGSYVASKVVQKAAETAQINAKK